MTEKHICPFIAQSDREHARLTLERILSQDTSWQRKEGQTYLMGNAAIGAALSAGASWERREPARSADLTGDVLVPLAQAGVTAVVGGLVGGLVGGPVAGLVTGGLTFGASWLILLVDHRRGLWLVERLTGVDINKDNVVGKPPVVTVALTEKTKAGGRVEYRDIQASDDQLAYLARALFVQRVPFSRDKLSGKGKPITDGQFRSLQKSLLDAGLIWPAGKGPNAGYKLNGNGRQFLTQFLQNE